MQTTLTSQETSPSKGAPNRRHPPSPVVQKDLEGGEHFKDGASLVPRRRHPQNGFALVDGRWQFHWYSEGLGRGRWRHHLVDLESGAESALEGKPETTVGTAPDNAPPVCSNELLVARCRLAELDHPAAGDAHAALDAFQTGPGRLLQEEPERWGPSSGRASREGKNWRVYVEHVSGRHWSFTIRDGVPLRLRKVLEAAAGSFPCQLPASLSQRRPKSSPEQANFRLQAAVEYLLEDVDSITLQSVLDAFLYSDTSVPGQYLSDATMRRERLAALRANQEWSLPEGTVLRLVAAKMEEEVRGCIWMARRILRSLSPALRWFHDPTDTICYSQYDFENARSELYYLANCLQAARQGFPQHAELRAVEDGLSDLLDLPFMGPRTWWRTVLDHAARLMDGGHVESWNSTMARKAPWLDWTPPPGP